MATNHTTNYNLNLWEANDKFVREEFNENTAKIDAAIKAHDTRMNGLESSIAAKPLLTYLKSQTLTADTAWLDVDLTGIDWSEWEVLVFKLYLKGTGQMTVWPNGQEIGNFAQAGATGHSSFGMCCHTLNSTGDHVTFVLFCGRTPARYIDALYLYPGYTAYSYCSYISFANLTKLSLVPYRGSNPFSLSAGCKVSIYGIH